MNDGVPDIISWVSGHFIPPEHKNESDISEENFRKTKQYCTYFNNEHNIDTTCN